MAYALAVNDPNEAYLRAGVVPPLYTAALVEPAVHATARRSIDPGAIRDARGGVHGEHDAFFLGPVHPGTVVQWTVWAHNARQTPAGVLVTLRILVSDLAGKPLVEHFWSSMHVGGIVDHDVGPDLAGHRFPEDARAHPVGGQVIPVAGDQTFRYAGASGDRVAHSTDDRAAREEGYPGKIVQGLCTLAMCGGAVVNLAAAGDPGRLRRLAGRFSSPMFPRRDLRVELYEAGPTADGGRAVAFEASSEGVAVIRHGRAEVAPVGWS
jgi:acyl dehydratase